LQTAKKDSRLRLPFQNEEVANISTVCRIYYECQSVGDHVLSGCRQKNCGGVTQVKLSRLAGIPKRYISEMENGKRPIGKEMTTGR
jgi:hypothetical protein